MFKKISKNETVIAGSCIIESGLQTSGNLKIYGKINGDVRVEGDVTIGETGVVLGKVTASNVTLSGTVEGDVHCTKTLKLTSSAKLSGDAYVKYFSGDKGCLFGGKCIMKEMEEMMEKSKSIDKNFDMTPPKTEKKSKLISELEDTEKDKDKVK